jgi:alpha-tubulin suppressor-like RCC1 family protein/tRNA A-37 threonylcarbamoyl transferase component Bud32
MRGDTELRSAASELEADYEIVGELGRGGTAIVYHARDRELGRDVAIKVIRPKFVEDDETVARLAREARTIAHLKHANIVTLYAVRHLRDNGLALVMQFVPGRTLKQAILDHGPLPLDVAERILTDIAEALAHAHAQGIVHRDVKPENIFLDETSGRAMLSDFGVARSVEHDAHLTATGMAIGTPTYMSPEQIDGGAVDARSDLYSLGCVAWEMLTGRRPWDGESLYGVIFRQKREDLPPIDDLRPGVPPRLLYLVEGLLPKAPERRFASTEIFLEQLANPVPPSGWRRWQADRKRRRRSRTYADARERGQSVVSAALATMRFRRGMPLPADAPVDTPRGALAAAIAGDTVMEAGEEDTALAGGAALDDDAPNEAAALAAPVDASAAVTTADASAPATLPFAAMLRERLAEEEAQESEWKQDRRGPTILAVLAIVIIAGTVAGISALMTRARESRLLADRAGLTDRPGVEIPVVAPRPVDTSTGALPLEDSTAARLAAADSLVAAGASSDTSSGTSKAPPDASLAASPNEKRTPPRPDTAASDRLARERGRATPPPTRAATTAAAPTPAAPAPAPVSPPAVDADAPPPTPTVAFTAERSVIGAGGRHSCLIARDGATYCWGANDRGQLGDGTSESHAKPAMVAGDLRFSQVTTGGSHSCAVTRGGDAYCWGENERGQLGDATTSLRTAPVRVAGSWSYRTVRAGAAHSCAIARDGEVVCWGANNDGQVGVGVSPLQTAPVVVAPELRFGALATGWNHTCALTLQGAAYCWGNNTNGQLGDGTRTERHTPVRLPTNERFVSIAAGSGHTCAVSTEGDVFCWGRNAGGQLGIGGTFDRLMPSKVAADRADFVSVTAGGVHTCARTRSGQVYCWGRNTYGQLGDGTTTDAPTPVHVGGSTSFIAVAASGAHTCAVGTTGESFCWGYNVAGQLGDGTRTHQPRPVRVTVSNDP